MTNSLAEVTARVAQLQSLLGLRPAGTFAGTGGAGTTSSSTFSEALTQAVGEGGDGATGSLATGRQAVTLARTYSGVPYLWGGTDPSKGLDCSGLVQLVYGKLGVHLPRVAADQARAGVEVPSLAQAQPGDLVFSGSPARHVGIFVGDGKMIDAPRAGSKVGVHSIAGYGQVSQIRRVAGPAEAAGTAAGTAATGPAGPYASLFADAGRRYGLDPALLAAVARTESSYDAGAVSPAGARGLMQLMPATARSLGADPDDPAQAVDGAARLIRNLLGEFGGRTDLALAGYNAGPGAVRRYGGVPPYPETRAYVQRVMQAWEGLR